ncbi:MAG TPA: tyrosine-type recombinase/integrase, partial [Actinomycetota bacterium]|nr:tyrosine-type recombinase/integrase [Actinomycetota bacterium]
WLSVAEERALRRAFARAAIPRDVALMETFLNVGLRIEEAAAMEAQHLKLGERSGSVEVVGKGRKRRVVQLNSRVRRALRTWLLHRPGGWLEPGPVWIGQRGGLSVSALHRIVARYGDLARLGDLSAHQLRHTAAKRLVESGARLEEVAAILGHENLNTTRRYVEPGREDLRKALERLAGDEDE